MNGLNRELHQFIYMNTLKNLSTAGRIQAAIAFTEHWGAENSGHGAWLVRRQSRLAVAKAFGFQNSSRRAPL